MVKHIVIFKLQGTPEERLRLAAAFKDALDPLPKVIPVLQDIEVALNANPAEDCDLVLTAVVPDMASVAAYAAHPAHVAAAGIVKGHVAARACVDYEVPFGR